MQLSQDNHRSFLYQHSSKLETDKSLDGILSSCYLWQTSYATTETAYVTGPTITRDTSSTLTISDPATTVTRYVLSSITIAGLLLAL